MTTSIFIADVYGTYADVTGDGTDYLISPTYVIYNEGNDYDGTDTYTAPENGAYFLTSHMWCRHISGDMDEGSFHFYTSNHWYSQKIAPNNTCTDDGKICFFFSTNVDMDAADIAEIWLRIENGTKDVDVYRGTFAGNLIQ